MIRYSKITKKNSREIVLLKGFPCCWGKCTFCDYTLDNGSVESEMLEQNNNVLFNVTGEFSKLEVVNSGSVFELPVATLERIKAVCGDKGIKKLFFESYYGYRHRLDEIRRYFGGEIVFKCGIETFDDEFRNGVLGKGVYFGEPKEVSDYFQSICIMVGIKGQTEEMIKRDIELLLGNFEYGCINIYQNNTTPVQADNALIDWFKKNFAYLEDLPNIDVLWKNTDFNVGGESNE